MQLRVCFSKQFVDTDGPFRQHDKTADEIVDQILGAET
jgi:hypothetical protein